MNQLDGGSRAVGFADALEPVLTLLSERFDVIVQDVRFGPRRSTRRVSISLCIAGFTLATHPEPRASPRAARARRELRFVSASRRIAARS